MEDEFHFQGQDPVLSFDLSEEDIQRALSLKNATDVVVSFVYTILRRTSVFTMEQVHFLDTLLFRPQLITCELLQEHKKFIADNVCSREWLITSLIPGVLVDEVYPQGGRSRLFDEDILKIAEEWRPLANKKEGEHVSAILNTAKNLRSKIGSERWSQIEDFVQGVTMDSKIFVPIYKSMTELFSPQVVCHCCSTLSRIPHLDALVCKEGGVYQSGAISVVRHTCDIYINWIIYKI